MLHLVYEFQGVIGFNTVRLLWVQIGQAIQAEQAKQVVRVFLWGIFKLWFENLP